MELFQEMFVQNFQPWSLNIQWRFLKILPGILRIGCWLFVFPWTLCSKNWWILVFEFLFVFQICGKKIARTCKVCRMLCNFHRTFLYQIFNGEAWRFSIILWNIIFSTETQLPGLTYFGTVFLFGSW
jgi:hypothetical protein